MPYFIVLLVSLARLVAAEETVPGAGPWIVKVEPLGAMEGTTITVNLVGTRLGRPLEVWFDTPAFRWEETLAVSPTKVTGRLKIAPGTALGPHLMHLRTADGRTNTRLFSVVQFRTVAELEPNNMPGDAQELELRAQVIQGALDRRDDVDIYQIRARQGERWVFDLRSAEYGSELDAELSINDATGAELAFNDDRDDYFESPFIEFTFPRDGIYLLKVAAPGGPARVDCGENCGYLLQISRLPVVSAVEPLGLQLGVPTRIKVGGNQLRLVEQAWVSPVRNGEFYGFSLRSTAPFRLGQDMEARARARIVRRSAGELELEFTLAPTLPEGLWRLWLGSPSGVTESFFLEVTKTGALAEGLTLKTLPVAISGRLSAPGEQDRYSIEAEAGRPIHAWTLGAQLGLPRIDTVLELLDGQGKRVAENDDPNAGQGADSSLYYLPKVKERLQLVVRDRMGRGGEGYAYRLHVASEPPGFRLVVEPEVLRVIRGHSTEVSVRVVPDMDFHEAVEVWVEGLPPGVTGSRALLSSDGVLKINVPPGLALGEYSIRVRGRQVGGRTTVEAFTTVSTSDGRRPLPAVTMTVVEAR